MAEILVRGQEELRQALCNILSFPNKFGKQDIENWPRHSLLVVILSFLFSGGH
jgi:hypothetical protein